MNRAHVIRLEPTSQQEEFFNKSCGCARFAYNWALARWKEDYGNGLKPSAYDLKKEFNQIKQERFPWILEVSKWSVEKAFFNLESAFKKFFRGQNTYPSFHRKFVHESFHIDGSVIQTNGKFIKLPKIGWTRMREALRFQDVKILSVTISKRAGKWFAAISCQLPDPVIPVRESQAVGVDLGIKELAVCSNGDRYEGSKALKHLLDKVRLLSRSLSRKQRGSNRRKQALRKLAVLHYRIQCIRQDYLHKLTTDLVNKFTDICIEDLNVQGMLKNHKLARHLADQAFGEFRRMLEYKAPTKGSRVHVIDRFFPSSKTCSRCGYVHKDLKLSDRTWQCPGCGTQHDRDLNASINILTAAGFAV